VAAYQAEHLELGKKRTKLEVETDARPVEAPQPALGCSQAEIQGPLGRLIMNKW